MLKRMSWMTVLMPLAAVFLFSCGGSDEKNTSSSATAAADRALADHDLTGAHATYESAAAANPNNLQAHFGAAITGLTLLPENPAVDDVMTLCGEPLLDVSSLIFGPDGLIAHEYANRQGQASMTFLRGQNMGSLTSMEFHPNSVYSNYDVASRIF